MADGNQEDAKFTRRLQRAKALAAAHPAIKNTGEITFGRSGASLELAVEVPLPNPWKAAGESPNGVRRIEPLRLDFPRSFPVDPPEVSLQPDFGRTLAHVQPWTTADGRPVPCIQDGQLSEFFHQQGLVGMLNQTTAWLEHAAEGRLIDPQQGWERTRRDFLEDYLLVDAQAVRGLVDRRGGHRFQKYDYLRIVQQGAPSIVHGEVHDEAVQFNPNAAKGLIRESAFNNDNTLRYGKSLVLIVWPGKEPSGKEIICAEYTPETVADLASLKARAALFGCAKDLQDALAWLARCAGEYDKAGPFSLAVEFCVRRPFPLIGNASAIELCSYLVDFYANNAFPEGDGTPVRPAGHRDRIAPVLLARMANVSDTSELRAWSLVGAGSLGSKVALHMVRAGRGPQAVIDRSCMSPHNFARHALIPRADDMQILSMDAKARLLASALEGFGAKPAAIVYDVSRVLSTRSLAREVWPKKTWAIVNTTASLRARGALAAAPNLPARVIEALLFEQGAIGVIATEGPDRNPNSNDLMAEFYALCQSDPALRDIILGGEDHVARAAIGEGCGSVTMRMTDGRLAQHAAALGEYLLSRQQSGLPTEDGELLVGRTDPSGLGVSWRSMPIAPITIVKPDNSHEWSVRIHPRAVQQIKDETARWPRVETGGVLVGRQDEVSGSFHIVDVIDGPPDSKRSASEFVLGTEGLKRRLGEYATSKIGRSIALAHGTAIWRRAARRTRTTRQGEPSP